MNGSGTPIKCADSQRRRHSAVINPPGFSRAIRASVEAIRERDAAARARFKAGLAVGRHQTATAPTRRQIYAEHIGRRFEHWCVCVLEAKVRWTDLELRKARCTLKQVPGPLRPLADDAPEDSVVRETVLVLASENGARRTLTISLHADKSVRAREDGGTDGYANRDHPQTTVDALDAWFAENLLMRFLGR